MLFNILEPAQVSQPRTASPLGIGMVVGSDHQDCTSRPLVTHACVAGLALTTWFACGVPQAQLKNMSK